MNKLKKTILLSMRDAAAAYFVLPLIEFLQRNKNFAIHIVAQRPAAGILESRKAEFLFIDSIPASNADGALALELLKEARKVVESTCPDLIIVGHSSDGVGIDEALVNLKAAPTILIQDFWGEVNTFFGVLPQYVFTFDSLSTMLTEQKYDVHCLEVGSIRHQTYQHLNPQRIRQHYRNELAFNHGSVAGWFGQSLHNCQGYRDTIKAWVEVMSKLRNKSDPGAAEYFVYKPHPLETDEDIAVTQEILKELGRVELLLDVSVEDALCLCDSVSSIMSNCLYDAAYINKIAGEPFITPLSILVSDELFEKLSKTVDFSALPYQTNGLAMVIRHKDDLYKSLSIAHTYKQKCYHYNSSIESLRALDGILMSAERCIFQCLQAD